MQDILYYNSIAPTEYVDICKSLFEIFQESLPKSTCKVWHRHPVWFLDGNPVAGYAIRKAGVTILFWSGQSFNEAGLKNEGSFKATQIVYKSVSDIQVQDLKRYLKKSREIQWDYKNIVKNKGRLDPIIGV
jgi:hypothetical protein